MKSQAEDLTGRRFGCYLVIRRAENRNGRVYFTCRCDCGQVRDVLADGLRAGSVSCGCAHRALRRPPVVIGGQVRITLTKGLVATVDIQDLELAQFNWSAHQTNGGWYAVRTDRQQRIYLHRAIAERSGLAIDGLEVDHKNGNRLDCRRDNLRPATHAQNTRNTKLRSTSSTGAKGVCWNPRRRKWTAVIQVDGSRKWLGHYDSIEQASAAYSVAARELHGEFSRAEAHLNNKEG